MRSGGYRGYLVPLIFWYSIHESMTLINGGLSWTAFSCFAGSFSSPNRAMYKWEMCKYAMEAFFINSIIVSLN